MYELLLDTNILIYASNPLSNFQSQAKKMLKQVLDRRLNGCISIQNLYEFYAVTTDPKRIEGSLKLSEVQEILKNYVEAENLPKIFPKETNHFNFLSLVMEYQIVKQEIFDAYLVATMMDNNVQTIYTADEGFFKKFEFLEVVNPFK